MVLSDGSPLHAAFTSPVTSSLGLFKNKGVGYIVSRIGVNCDGIQALECP